MLYLIEKNEIGGRGM